MKREVKEDRDRLRIENKELRSKLKELSSAAAKAADEVVRRYKENGAIGEPLFVRELRAAIESSKLG